MNIQDRVKEVWNRIPNKFKGVVVFLVGLLLIGAVQTGTWKEGLVVDGGAWFMAVGEAEEWRFPKEEDFLFGYPATTFLIPAAQLEEVFNSREMGMRATFVLFATLAGALSVLLAYLLRPKSIWWVFVAIALAFQTQYVLSTPPAALLVALAPTFVLLALYAGEKQRLSVPLLGALGIWAGLMLATRVDLSVPIIAAFTLYLAIRRGAALYIIPLLATTTFALLNPSLWTDGVMNHISGILAKILFIAETSPFDSKHPLYVMFNASKFGIFAVFLGVLLFLSKRLQSLPRNFFLALAGVSILIFGGLSLTHHHPEWMFAPLLVVWHVFLPLFVMDAYKALPENASVKKLKPEGALLRVVAPIYVALVILAYYVETAIVFK